MSKALAGSSVLGVARFRLLSGSDEQTFTIVMEKGTARTVSTATEHNVDFEIITTPETWIEIARGALAPLEAFTNGRMRVRGDIKVGQAIMHRLSSPTGRMDFC
jgi:putative sterol carrier protein